MKHKGSVSHTYRRRDAVVIPFLFRKAKAIADYPTNTHKLFKIASELPVDRYYISDDAALRYIRNRYYKGKQAKFRSRYKEQIFESLYDLVSDMMKEEKYKTAGLATTTIMALSRPAPCVGLTPNEIYLRHLNLRGYNRKNLKDEKV